MGQGLNEQFSEGTPKSLLEKHNALMGPSAHKMKVEFEKMDLDNDDEINGALDVLDISKRSTKFSSNLHSFVAID